MRHASEGKAKVYDYKRAWNYALWLLSRQMLSEKQLRDKLHHKQVQPEDITRIINQLHELRYLDDVAYAETLRHSRSRRKGSLAIKQELQRKGIAETTISETLEQLSPEQECATARDILAKNAWRFAKDDAYKNYRKAYAFLARRGFTSDIAKQALEAHFAEA